MDKDSEVTADGYFEEGKAGLKKQELLQAMESFMKNLKKVEKVLRK